MRLQVTPRDFKRLRGTTRDVERPQETRETSRDFKRLQGTSRDFKGLQGDFYGLQETSLQSN